jgi:hypothetical protein
MRCGFATAVDRVDVLHPCNMYSRQRKFYRIPHSTHFNIFCNLLGF